MCYTEHMPTAHNARAEGKHIIAVLSYIWILVVVLFLIGSQKDPFVKYHMKQGLALLVFEAIGWVAGWVLIFIPIIGWFIMWLWWLTSIILAIIGILHVLNGEEKPLPIVGGYGLGFKI